MQNTDRRMKQAQRAAAYWQAMASNPNNYNSGSYWLDVAAQAADLAKQIKMQNIPLQKQITHSHKRIP